MRFMLFYLILLFGLFTKESKAFTFQMCQQENGEMCNEQIFSGDSFKSISINDFFLQNQQYTYIFIDQSDLSDLITVNLDNISDNLTVSFRNKTFYSKITIQTNYDEDTDINTFIYPTLNALGRDLIIDNINPKNDKTVFMHKQIFFKSITEKDKTKPLYFIRKGDYIYTNSIIYSYDRFLTPVLYLSYQSASVYLEEEEFDENRTIILIPHLLHRYDNSYSKISRISVNLYVNTKIIYGKNQITIEFRNNNTLTIQSESRQVDLSLILFSDTIITVEEGVNEYDLFSLYFNNNQGKYVNGSFVYSRVEILGNWPTIKTTYFEDEYIDDGIILEGHSKLFCLYGPFIYSANNFPLRDFSQFTLNLTQNISSVYCIDDIFYSNMSLVVQNEFETVFIIDGLHTRTNPNPFYHSFINTESPLLKIFANTKDEINMTGPASITYVKIDNRKNEINKALNLLRGGTINIPYGINYEDFFDQFIDIYNNYIEENPEPVNSTIQVWFDFSINFAKEKVSDLAFTLNDLENKFFQPMTVNVVEDSSYVLNTMNTLTINRNDLQFSLLYLNSLNKESKVLCVENGLINLSEWKVTLDRRAFRGFSDEGIDYDVFYREYIPHFSDVTFSFEHFLTDNDKCISIRPKTIPKSSFEIFVYTSNETYIEILEKVDIVNVLTPTDLDVASKIVSTNTRDFVFVILNDFPDGKSIDLTSIKSDSNVLLFGFKAESTDKILECFQKYKDLNQIDFAKFISDFASNYMNYQPKVSILINKVKTLFVTCVNYLGSSISCTYFWAILSSFPNLVNNPSNFRSQVTVTETVTYKLISNLNFVDLTIIPISLNPLNILTIEQCNFTEKSWTLQLTEYIKEEGFTKEDKTFFTISTQNVRNGLFLYSFEYGSILTVPEDWNDQKIPGVSINYFSAMQPKITEVKGMFPLEDNDISMSLFQSLFQYTNSFHKRAKLFEGEDDENNVNDRFIFTGNWDKVSSIKGTIEINTAAFPAIVENVPTIVAQSLDVKSDKKVEITTQTENIFFSKPQIVSQTKTITFHKENLAVSFSNLTFNGDVARLSLLINDKPSKVVTDHALIESGTYAIISSEIEIKESIEIGPESSIKAGNIISPTGVKLTMDYRLGAKFGKIPDEIEPSTVVLNYIGETDNLGEETDYSIYFCNLNEIRSFNGNDHKEKCNEWLSKSSLHSDFYPEFRVKGQVVDVVCIDDESTSVLAVNVTAVPEGEVIIPTDDDSSDDSNFDPTDNEVDDDGNGGGNGDTPKDKKKMSFFLLCAIIVGAIVLIVIVIVIVVAYKSLSKKKKNQENNEGQSKDDQSLGENTDNNFHQQTKEVPREEDKNAKLDNSSDKDNESDMDFWIYP